MSSIDDVVVEFPADRAPEGAALPVLRSLVQRAIATALRRNGTQLIVPSRIPIRSIPASPESLQSRS
ncbi:hypothetical protein G6038_18230 [Rhodococcus sp. 14C212]|uniref:hypothetical protein n=1 Tax=Rhodococcus sp. 14C212 TaxID=2711209 RepID=UPI0013EC95CC|nr:hypothetical protein [Rhodococcus sp. 14C212]NGP07378.1 hypothetical protein [Rhodococcus sp. 14C212]